MKDGLDWLEQSILTTWKYILGLVSIMLLAHVFRGTILDIFSIKRQCSSSNSGEMIIHFGDSYQCIFVGGYPLWFKVTAPEVELDGTTSPKGRI